jgi:hypothetical protein
MRIAIPLPLALPMFLAAACGPTAASGELTRAAMPDMAQVSPGAPAPDLATNDSGCGGQQFKVTRVVPNVFLVIDRSGSMSDAIGNGDNTEKWTDLQSAVSTLVTTYDDQIRLGMSMFSSDNNCAPGTIATPLAASNGATVLSKLSAMSPNGNTPTATTLDTVIASGGLTDPTRPNVVVLATDGLPNCSDTDVTSRIKTLATSTPPVNTYVIGVGSDTSSNPALLNTWAETGGTARVGAAEEYYQSNSASDLTTAFSSIVSGVVSCNFALSSVPPDPSQLYVWLGGVMVPNDPTNGYTYVASPASIVLNGTTCATLNGSTSDQVQIEYGCPAPPPVQ